MDAPGPGLIPADGLSQTLQELDDRLRGLPEARPEDALKWLIKAPDASLPLPGRGNTLARWQNLARVGAHDLALTKLYEAHMDALAILAEFEITGGFPAEASWSVWAADAPAERLQISEPSGGRVLVNGCKAWCSGAATVDYALCTAWRGNEGPYLIAVALEQTAISIDHGRWRAVGMAGTSTCDVAFDNAAGQLIGDSGAYLDRPGFWHGAAGIAACWYGGAVGLASALWQRECTRALPYADAHLGAIDTALAQTAALLRETAVAIDQAPQADIRARALRCRASAEATAQSVLSHVGKAMGAVPFCRDDHFARLAADLPVFLRQSHADHDFAALAKTLKADLQLPWRL